MGTQIDHAKVEATRIGFNTIFQNAIDKAAAVYQTLAMTVRSNTTTEQYNWLGAYPQVKEWLGDRPITKLRNYDFQIVNKKWANGIEIDRSDLADDRLGMYSGTIAMLGQAVADHYDRLIGSLLTGSATTACYDGQYMVDTDHEAAPGGSAQSNKGTSALDATSLGVAFQTMYSLVATDSGTPLNITPTHLVIGPKLWSTALTLLRAQNNADGASNIYYQSVTPVLCRDLVGTYDDYWFLMDLGKPVKPLVLQIREDVQFRAVDGLNEEAAFHRDKLFYGADGRHNAGYGLWQLVYGGIL